MVSSSSTHLFVISWSLFFSFAIFHSVNMMHFFLSLICWCTAQLFPFSSHYELRSKPIFPYQEVKSFGYIPKSDIAETWCRFYLQGPWETLILISIITLQVVTSTSNEWMFSLYHTLSNINGPGFFLNCCFGHSERYDVKFQNNLDFHFPRQRIDI